MNAEKIDVTALNDDGITWTFLATLFLRAYESRSPRSILKDHHAAETVARIDYDFAKLSGKLRPSGNQFLVTLRAKALDDWCSGFLARHPDATVLHLGCGLDSRALRLGPPPTVRWYDLDIPKVIDLRRRLSPEREGYHLIGASVTDPGWLADVPADKPTLIVAEGLLPYLPPAEVHRLIDRLVEHFPGGELIFDAGAPWLTRLMKTFHWALRDGHELEARHPGLELVAQSPYTTNWRLIHVRGYRMLYQLFDRAPGLRTIFQWFRFRF